MNGMKIRFFTVPLFSHSELSCNYCDNNDDEPCKDSKRRAANSLSRSYAVNIGEILFSDHFKSNKIAEYFTLGQQVYKAVYKIFLYFTCFN